MSEEQHTTENPLREVLHLRRETRAETSVSVPGIQLDDFANQLTEHAILLLQSFAYIGHALHERDTAAGHDQVPRADTLGEL